MRDRAAFRLVSQGGVPQTGLGLAVVRVGVIQPRTFSNLH